MNVHTNPKSVNMTAEEAVEKLTDKYAKAEKYLRLAGDALRSMPDLYMAVHKAGSVGFLEAQERATNAKVAAGLVANAEHAVAVAHVHDTERAKKLGIDVPTVMSGGGGR